MMWERVRELVEEQGCKVVLGARVESIRRSGGRAVTVVTRSVATEQADGGVPASGQTATASWPVDHLISSMPLSELVQAMDPPAPEEVRQAARALRYRDFLTVALVLPADRGFPDNWIYVHSEKVRVGRVQNFGSWSPDLVKQGRTCLGLEYFVFEGDDLWSAADEELVALGTCELETLGLVQPGDVEKGFVVRMPKAYPVYDAGYHLKVQAIREWLEAETPNVHPVGRNGMHRYNNQDHSMLTAMLTVEGLFGERFDTWAVNVESDYHEQQVGRQSGGCRRAAPVPVEPCRCRSGHEPRPMRGRVLGSPAGPELRPEAAGAAMPGVGPDVPGASGAPVTAGLGDVAEQAGLRRVAISPGGTAMTRRRAGRSCMRTKLPAGGLPRGSTSS